MIMAYDTRIVTLDIERILSHELAHAINNSLGAMGVLLDILSQDVHDQTAIKRIGSLMWAVRLAVGNVNALRQAIPKPEEDTGASDLSFVLDTATLMLGDHASRFKRDLEAEKDFALLGDRAVMAYVFYHLVAHVIGAVQGDVRLTCQNFSLSNLFEGELIFGERLDEDQESVSIDIIGSDGNVNPMMVDPDLWTDICDDQGCCVSQSSRGFQIIWPRAGR